MGVIFFSVKHWTTSVATDWVRALTSLKCNLNILANKHLTIFWYLELQQMVGAFEIMLGPSPPATSMSPAPVHHGGPPPPHGGPPIPHGGPSTPHGPPTPLGNNTGGGMGHGVPGMNTNCHQGSKLYEKNKMLASLLAKEPVHQVSWVLICSILFLLLFLLHSCKKWRLSFDIQREKYARCVSCTSDHIIRRK